MVEGRMNLGFVGIPTFYKVPYQDLEDLDADVAIIGAPFDLGTQFRAGSRFGPRAIRAASTIYSLRGTGYYDFELDTQFLEGVRIVDCGDIDMLHLLWQENLERIQRAVETAVAHGALPVLLGGDHSITAPIVRGLTGKKVYVIQFDAHLDFVDDRLGVRDGHGNGMRRIAEMDHVIGLAQIGIRGPGSSDRSDFDAARQYGSTIIGMREFRRIGVEGVLERIPVADNYYVTIDADAFDAALARGCGSPSVGGLNYYDVVDILYGISKKGEVLGMDFVEVSPQYDHSEVTAQLAARVIMDFLGYIFADRKERGTWNPR